MNHNLIFNIQESKPDEVIINVNTEIGSYSEKQFGAKAFADQLQGLQDKTIVMRINSPGGAVSDALQIYDLLSQHPKPVRTETYGATASAATIIGQAGHRLISENALYLVHHAWGMSMGNRFDMANMAKDLEKFDNRIMRIYEARGANMKKVKSFMAKNGGHGQWLEPQEALSAGLVDEILTEPKVNAKFDPELFKSLNLPQLPANFIKKAEPVQQQPKKEHKVIAHVDRSKVIRYKNYSRHFYGY